MNNRFHFILGIFIVSVLIMPVRNLTGDIGPKPSMTFNFSQESSVQPVTIISGILYECDEPDCSDAKPLEELGPQRFSCEENSCYAMAYGFSKYHRLEIKFSDGISRSSNIFTKIQFQATFQVTIRQTDLLVKPKLTLDFFSPLTYLLICIGGLLGLGVIVVAVIIVLRRAKK